MTKKGFLKEAYLLPHAQARVHGACLERVRIAQVHQLNLRVLGDDCVHYRLGIRRSKDVILSNQSPVSIRDNEVLPHLHVAEYATALSRSGRPGVAIRYRLYAPTTDRTRAPNFRG